MQGRTVVDSEIASSIRVTDVVSRIVIGSIPVGSNPFGVAVTPGDSRAFVTRVRESTSQDIALLQRTLRGVERTTLLPVRFVPMTGEAESR